MNSRLAYQICSLAFVAAGLLLSLEKNGWAGAEKGPVGDAEKSATEHYVDIAAGEEK